MSSLVIQRPVLNEEWIEDNLTELEEWVYNHFEMSPLDDWAAWLDSDDFTEKYETRTNSQADEWYHRYYFDYVYYKIPQYVKNCFIEADIYEKRIDNDDLIDEYNAALLNAVDQLGFNYALAWAVYLKCAVGNDGGVVPYSKMKKEGK